MKSLLKVLVGIVVGLAALMLISGLAIRLLLSSSAKGAVLASLESRLKAPVSIEGGDFDLAQWFLFTPAITLRGFSIGNPEGFSAGKMLEAEQVTAQVALLSLFSNPIDVKSLVLRRPQLNLETNRQGQSNIAVLSASSAGSGAGAEPPGAGSSTAVAIHGLSLEDGTVRYIEAGEAKPVTIDEINLKLSDFAPDKSCRFELSGRLFGSNHSRLGFDGNAGPFGPSSIAAKGELRLDLAPGEIPAAIRQKYFGSVLADPGDDSRIAVKTDVDGDLLAALRGTGKLSFEKFQAGRDSQHRVELLGEAPLDLTAQHVLGKPAIDLATSGASLKLGSGQWKGNAEFHFGDSRLRGKINGAISGVDMNELLSAFSEAGGSVLGRRRCRIWN